MVFISAFLTGGEQGFLFHWINVPSLTSDSIKTLVFSTLQTGQEAIAASSDGGSNIYCLTGGGTPYFIRINSGANVEFKRIPAISIDTGSSKVIKVFSKGSDVIYGATYFEGK